MYNELDSANQRAIVQAQPFVSNFVGGETMEGSKTWKSPGIVGPSPASFGRTQSRSNRRFSSPPKGTIRKASRLPRSSNPKGSCGAEEVTISPSRSMSNEESVLEIDHLTVRAIMGEDAVAVVKSKGGDTRRCLGCF